jgi:hypothetical protein
MDTGMKVIDIKFAYFLIVFVLLSTAVFAAYPIAGVVNDAANKSADGHTIRARYINNTLNFTTDIIGITGNSNTSNAYLVDLEEILGHPLVEVGNVVILEVINNGDGYIAGPVNVTISGDPVNDSLAIPAMTLKFSQCLDADNDTYLSALCEGGNDCNDSNPAINPGAAEVCGDGIDQDCSGSDLACPTTTPTTTPSSGGGGGGGSGPVRTTSTVNRTTTTIRSAQTTTTIKPTTVPTTTLIVTPVTTTVPGSRGLVDSITGLITSSPALAGIILLILIAILILLLQKGMKKRKEG